MVFRHSWVWAGVDWLEHVVIDPKETSIRFESAELCRLGLLLLARGEHGWVDTTS